MSHEYEQELKAEIVRLRAEIQRLREEIGERSNHNADQIREILGLHGEILNLKKRFNELTPKHVALQRDNKRLRELVAHNGIDPDMPIPPYPITWLRRHQESGFEFHEELLKLMEEWRTEDKPLMFERVKCDIDSLLDKYGIMGLFGDYG